MPKEPFYPGADTTQDFSRTYSGAPIHPNVNVLHTTEGTDWPDYSGGSTAPHLTVKPLITERRFAVRQHFPLTMSSRALRNETGGVETNTLNCIQIELIGTCDPDHRDTWGTRRAGRDYLFWPEAPDWALRELAGMLAWMHQQWAIKAPRAKAMAAVSGVLRQRRTPAVHPSSMATVLRNRRPHARLRKRPRRSRQHRHATGSEACPRDVSTTREQNTEGGRGCTTRRTSVHDDDQRGTQTQVAADTAAR